MEIFNLPNSLTLLRILLLPVFTYFFLQGEYRKALIIFVITGITDFVDGALARALKKKTALGAALDPAADKLLMLVTFIVLTLRGLVPLELSMLVIARDLWIVSGILLLKSLKKKFYLHPTRLSKLNTFFQLWTIFLAFLLTLLRAQKSSKFLSYRPTLELLLQVSIYLTAGMTIASGIQYTRIGWRILRDKRHYAEGEG